MKTSNVTKKNTNKRIPIFLSAKKNDFPALDVALLSIKDNISSKFEYAVYILHEGMETELQQTIARLSDKKFQIVFIDVSGYQDGDMAYHAILPTLCPNMEKALHFNCNVVALSDIAELYNAELSTQSSAFCFPKLLDYSAGKKPWHYTDVPYQDYFWKYAVQSVFYKELLFRLKNFVSEETTQAQVF